jgi:hypothetical protein
MSKLKFITKIMIYWKKFFIIEIHKSNKGLRYEGYILFILVLPQNVFPFYDVFKLFFQRMIMNIIQ